MVTFAVQWLKITQYSLIKLISQLIEILTASLYHVVLCMKFEDLVAEFACDVKWFATEIEGLE